MTLTQSAASPVQSSVSNSSGRTVISTIKGIALAVLTVAGLLAAGSYDPYTAFQQWIQGGGADAPSQQTKQDPATADVQHGYALLSSFASWPRPPASVPLVLFLGNSQQYTCSLPRGAHPDPSREALVASDLLAMRLNRSSDHPIAIYNGAAPNQTLVEELWQGIYWFKVGHPKPAGLVIAASFDTFRKTGIRYGFQTLLGDPAFSAALDTVPLADRPYAAEFQAARKAFAEPQSQPVGTASKDGSVETWLRQHMESLPLYGHREQRRAAFLNVLYLLRVHILQLSPTTKRHITGQPSAANFAALADLLSLARASGTALFIYNAPVNPAISMFYPEEYRDYMERLRTLAREQSATFADLGNAVPAEQWGYFIDGPDPIHFDEHGHRTVAERLDSEFGPMLLQLGRK